VHTDALDQCRGCVAMVKYIPPYLVYSHTMRSTRRYVCSVRSMLIFGHMKSWDCLFASVPRDLRHMHESPPCFQPPVLPRPSTAFLDSPPSYISDKCGGPIGSKYGFPSCTCVDSESNGTRAPLNGPCVSHGAVQVAIHPLVTSLRTGVLNVHDADMVMDSLC
jgi:hypothetical protein